MLTEMLTKSADFQKKTLPEQTIYYKLAGEFQNNTQYLFMTPEELVIHTEIGTKEQWQDLLTLNETNSFIKGQMAFLSQVNQRKTFASLVQMALNGNQGAAKQVQELSGILNQQDTNRTIILHRIPRPEVTE